jgi:hypothetical protein
MKKILGLQVKSVKSRNHVSYVNGNTNLIIYEKDGN